VTSYAVDSDVFVHIQRLRFSEDFAKCGRLPIVVTDVVWSEVCSSKDDRANAEMQKLLTSIGGSPRIIDPETPEAATFARLEQAPKGEHPGEHSIIALAINDPQLVPVLLDRQALSRAIEELRRRPILSMHGFLDELVASNLVPRDLARGFAHAYRRRCSVAVPHWW
jgi:hypothetical protein